MTIINTEHLMTSQQYIHIIMFKKNFSRNWALINSSKTISSIIFLSPGCLFQGHGSQLPETHQ